MEQAWARNASIQLIDVGIDYYFVRFNCIEDYDFALTGGPWLIFDHYLAIRGWKPLFNPYAERINKIAVWARLPRLTMEYYDDRTLFEIGDQIGTTLKVDVNTKMQARGKFARIYVEVDLDKPLIPFYVLDGVQLNFEYEDIHMVCFSSGKFGHAKENGLDKKVEEHEKQNANMISCNKATGSTVDGSTEAEKEDDGRYGPWMMVERKPRQRPQNQRMENADNRKGEISGENRE